MVKILDKTVDTLAILFAIVGCLALMVVGCELLISYN